MTALNNTNVGTRCIVSLRETFVQIAKFMTVGVLNTAIDAAAYFALTRWLGLGSMLVLARGGALYPDPYCRPRHQRRDNGTRSRLAAPA